MLKFQIYILNENFSHKEDEYGMTEFHLPSFFDENGPLFLEIMEKGGKINANTYCTNLHNPKTTIKGKRPGMLLIILLYDKAHPCGKRVLGFAAPLLWEVRDRPSLWTQPGVLRLPNHQPTEKCSQKLMPKSGMPLNTGSRANNRLSSFKLCTI